jgi:hypothetical protein
MKGRLAIKGFGVPSELNLRVVWSGFLEVGNVLRTEVVDVEVGIHLAIVINVYGVHGE